jgi:ketosteroid isomerase-like protein
MNMLHLSSMKLEKTQMGRFIPSLPTRRPRIGALNLVASATPAPPSSSSSTSTKPVRTATEAAMAYYTNYNNKNIPAVLELIAENCVYEDLIYQDPFVGRANIAKYFEKIEQLVPKDIKFVVEDITEGDPKKVGVRWHVELDGVAQFPFSRGVSFYEVNDQGQIIFARDIVEPTFKPGAAALQGISVVAPLVRKLGPAADPSNLSKLPIAAAAMGGFWLAYISYVMFSTAAPGLPVWQTTPETLQSVINESYNFFYVNIILEKFNLNPVPCVAEHPVGEALFNFVNAWSLMLLPIWANDKLQGKKPVDSTTKICLFVGTMFLTNVFLPIYLALRLIPASASAGEEVGEKIGEEEEVKGTGIPNSASISLPSYVSPLFGSIAGVVGITSLLWAAFARPELAGDLSSRFDYFATMASTDRVFWAFCVDSVLYSVWQAWLLADAGDAKTWQRFVPFFGMAGYLLFQNNNESSSGGEKKTEY